MSSRRAAFTRPVATPVFASLLVILAISAMTLGGLCHTFLRQIGFYTPYEAQHDLAYEATIALDRLSHDLLMSGYAPGTTLQDGLSLAQDILQIRADFDGDGNTAGPHEHIRYAYVATTHQLIRQDHTGSVVVLDDVQSCTFTPLDRFGEPVSIAALARQVRVTLSTREPQLAPGHKPSTLTTTVHLRNLSS